MIFHGGRNSPMNLPAGVTVQTLPPSSVLAMNGILYGGDAAFPPPGGHYPSYVTVGAFYIGGDTPHVWSQLEINVMAERVDYLLPVFVRSDPAVVNALDDAHAIVASLHDLGAPSDCLVIVDYEIAIDHAHFEIVKNNIGAHGVAAYGSADFVFQNGAEWNWVAEPGALHPDIRAKGTQYHWGVIMDLTWWDTAFADAHMWPTKAKPSQPVLHEGDTGNEVRKLQELLVKHFPVDGIFGMMTEAMVRAFQRKNGLAVDGIVGPATWKVLEK